jgi:hypothetical protein
MMISLYNSDGWRLAVSSTQVRRKSDSRKSKATSTWPDKASTRGCTLLVFFGATTLLEDETLLNTRASTSSRALDITNRVGDTSTVICFLGWQLGKSFSSFPVNKSSTSTGLSKKSYEPHFSEAAAVSAKHANPARAITYSKKHKTSEQQPE